MPNTVAGFARGRLRANTLNMPRPRASRELVAMPLLKLKKPMRSISGAFTSATASWKTRYSLRSETTACIGSNMEGLE